MSRDVLVEAIFEAVDRQEFSPEQKRVAVVRAGLIAQAYVFDADLFFSLKQDNDVNTGLGCADNGGTTH